MITTNASLDMFWQLRQTLYLLLSIHTNANDCKYYSSTIYHHHQVINKFGSENTQSLGRDIGIVSYFQPCMTCVFLLSFEMRQTSEVNA